MNAPFVMTRMTVEQFFGWLDERRAALDYDEPKWELFDGIPQMQESERWAHGRIKYKLTKALERALAVAGLPYEAAVDCLAVRIGPGQAFQPDAVVFPAGVASDDDRTAPDPIIVAEVLSPSSVHTDLRTKARGYGQVGSVQHYLVLDPGTETVRHFRRQGSELIAPDEPVAGTILLDPPGTVLDTGEAFAR